VGQSLFGPCADLFVARRKAHDAAQSYYRKLLDFEQEIGDDPLKSINNFQV
jgi:hypothetical protein